MNIECEKEITSGVHPMTTAWGMTRLYILRCKTHGDLLRDEETNFNTAYAIQERFHDAWFKHVADTLLAKKAPMADTPFEYECIMFNQPENELAEIQAMAAQKAQAYHAAHPKPAVLTAPATATVTCEKLLVERVGDDAQGTHYMILLCKRHGQLSEQVIYPATAWQLQGDMDRIFRYHVNHVNNPEPQPQPRTKPEPFDPASRFGRIAKRKFG